ncbi:Uncharacterised protein [Streptococcus downei MFe28]|uniref:Uncharacterized protein n=1 Tax=Streptococcus downei MFe28 TaxID=764290 RepID=A0A380JCJ4_STRDO|nr:Uncharacterised protein [Streptococcus downei MFe28]
MLGRQQQTTRVNRNYLKTRSSVFWPFLCALAKRGSNAKVKLRHIDLVRAVVRARFLINFAQ